MVSTKELTDTLLKWTETMMRAQMTTFWRYAKKCGFSISQVGALFRLYRHGLSTGVSDIGDHLGVSSAAASQMIDRLVQQGLLLRSEDPDDRRVKRITLTEQGRKVIDDGVGGRERWFTSVGERMSEQERETVLAGLKILIRTVNETVSEEESSRKSMSTKEKAGQ